STVAGTGQQSHWRKGTASGPGKTTARNSRWDVSAQPGARALLLAIARPHHIARYDLDTGIVSISAGTGMCNLVDAKLGTTACAQPSGLATEGPDLIVAEGEVPGVRSSSLDRRNHRVQTIVGNGLFVFDDIDGSGDVVRLQHCLGVAYGDGKLYIADTYNNK